MESKFKQYTGTKTVKAMFMGAGEAKRCGANLTDEVVKKNLGNDGYLVEYPDGYRSWSPAKAFEGAYRIAETHIDRMKIELADLNERICKATRAINSFDAIPEDERRYLKKQLEAMQMYADCLHDRIRNAVEPRVSSDPCCCKQPIKEGGK